MILTLFSLDDEKFYFMTGTQKPEVAVHTPTIKIAENKACKDFQKIFNQYAVSSETFSGAFKNSGKGTNINVCITKFIKE